MKNLLKKVSAALLLVPALVLGVSFFAVPASAAPGDCKTESGLSGAIGGSDCVDPGGTSGLQTNQLFGDNGIIGNIINLMLFIVGILSVIIIIFGGIRYVISRGKEDEVKNAKNTILYSVIGLIVAIIAYALVNWVFGVVGNNP
jgi:amino acid transporter